MKGGYRSIGEVADDCGISRSALRHWEEQGLLKPSHSTSGYRQYDNEQVARVRFVQRAQALGLTLAEVRDLLRAADGDGEATVRDCLRRLLASKLAETHRRMHELTSFASQIEKVRDRLGEPTCGCRHVGGCDCLPPDLGSSAMGAEKALPPTLPLIFEHGRQEKGWRMTARPLDGHRGLP